MTLRANMREQMAAWVKCTDGSGRAIFLNLDHAISIVAPERTGLSRVASIGEDTVEVKETPDYLIKTAD